MPSCSKFAYDVLARIKKPLARVLRTFTCFSIKISKLDLNTFIPNKAYISNLSILNGVPVVYFKDQNLSNEHRSTSVPSKTS